MAQDFVVLMGLEAIHIVIFHASLGRFCRVTSSARPMHPDGSLPMHLVWEPVAPSPGAWAEHIPAVSTSECVWDPPLSECLDNQAVQGWNANADYFSAGAEGILGPAARLFPFPAARLPSSPAPSACVWSFDGTKRMLLEKETVLGAGEPLVFPPLSPASHAAAARVFVPGSSPPRQASTYWLCTGSGPAPAQLEGPWAEHWRGADIVREPLRSDSGLSLTCVSVDAAFLPSPSFTPPVLVSERDRLGHRSAVWRYQAAQGSSFASFQSLPSRATAAVEDEDAGESRYQSPRELATEDGEAEHAEAPPSPLHAYSQEEAAEYDLLREMVREAPPSQFCGLVSGCAPLLGWPSLPRVPSPPPCSPPPSTSALPLKLPPSSHCLGVVEGSVASLACEGAAVWAVHNRGALSLLLPPAVAVREEPAGSSFFPGPQLSQVALHPERALCVCPQPLLAVVRAAAVAAPAGEPASSRLPPWVDLAGQRCGEGGTPSAQLERRALGGALAPPWRALSPLLGRGLVGAWGLRGRDPGCHAFAALSFLQGTRLLRLRAGPRMEDCGAEVGAVEDQSSLLCAALGEGWGVQVTACQVAALQLGAAQSEPIPAPWCSPGRLLCAAAWSDRVLVLEAGGRALLLARRPNSWVEQCAADLGCEASCASEAWTGVGPGVALVAVGTRSGAVLLLAVAEEGERGAGGAGPGTSIFQTSRLWVAQTLSLDALSSSRGASLAPQSLELLPQARTPAEAAEPRRHVLLLVGLRTGALVEVDVTVEQLALGPLAVETSVRGCLDKCPEPVTVLRVEQQASGHGKRLSRCNGMPAALTESCALALSSRSALVARCPLSGALSVRPLRGLPRLVAGAVLSVPGEEEEEGEELDERSGSMPAGKGAAPFAALSSAPLLARPVFLGAAASGALVAVFLDGDQSDSPNDKLPPSGAGLSFQETTCLEADSADTLVGTQAAICPHLCGRVHRFGWPTKRSDSQRPEGAYPHPVLSLPPTERVTALSLTSAGVARACGQGGRGEPGGAGEEGLGGAGEEEVAGAREEASDEEESGSEAGFWENRPDPRPEVLETRFARFGRPSPASIAPSPAPRQPWLVQPLAPLPRTSPRSYPIFVHPSPAASSPGLLSRANSLLAVGSGDSPGGACLPWDRLCADEQEAERFWDGVALGLAPSRACEAGRGPEERTHDGPRGRIRLYALGQEGDAGSGDGSASVAASPSTSNPRPSSGSQTCLAAQLRVPHEVSALLWLHPSHALPGAFPPLLAAMGSALALLQVESRDSPLCRRVARRSTLLHSDASDFSEEEDEEEEEEEERMDGDDSSDRDADEAPFAAEREHVRRLLEGDADEEMEDLEEELEAGRASRRGRGIPSARERVQPLIRTPSAQPSPPASRALPLRLALDSWLALPGPADSLHAAEAPGLALACLPGQGALLLSICKGCVSVVAAEESEAGALGAGPLPGRPGAYLVLGPGGQLRAVERRRQLGLDALATLCTLRLGLGPWAGALARRRAEGPWLAATAEGRVLGAEAAGRRDALLLVRAERALRRYVDLVGGDLTWAKVPEQSSAGEGDAAPAQALPHAFPSRLPALQPSRALWRDAWTPSLLPGTNALSATAHAREPLLLGGGRLAEFLRCPRVLQDAVAREVGESPARLATAIRRAGVTADRR